MNKVTPKKIMEIIYIFILPLLFLLPSFMIHKGTEIYDESFETTDYFITYNDYILGGNNTIVSDALNYVFESLNLNPVNMVIAFLIDYIVLWFIMFITWHLLYIPFDTLMHKVLLRKD